MKKEKLKNISGIVIVAIVAISLNLASCSSNNSNKIKVDIPTELQNNTEVVNYIKALTQTTNKATEIFNSIAEITGGEDVDDSDELTTMQTLKLAKSAAQMMMISSEMDEYEIQRTSIDSSLSVNEIHLLDSVCDILKTHMGKIDPSNTSIDEEEMAVQEVEKGELNGEAGKTQTELEEVQNQHTQLNGQDYESSSDENIENDEFSFVDVLFPIGILILMIFFAIRSIKKLKSRVKDFGYTVGDIKDKIHEAKEMTDKKSPDGKKMTAEDKKGLDMLDNLLNKK